MAYQQPPQPDYNYAAQQPAAAAPQSAQQNPYLNQQPAGAAQPHDAYAGYQQPQQPQAPQPNGHAPQMNGHSQPQQPQTQQYQQPQTQQPQTQQYQQPQTQHPQTQQPQTNQAQFNYQQPLATPAGYSQPPAKYVPPGAHGYDAMSMSPISTPGMRAGSMPTQPLPSVAEQKTNRRKISERIDPKQIPRPVQPKARAELIKYYTRSGAVPPASSAEYMAIDEGNCSPRFVRMTTYQLANEGELLESTKLCIGAIIQPLASLQPGEEGIHVVDPGPTGILRCPRCRGYVNPFFKFIEGGSKFKCNLCGTVSEVPAWYQCNLDANGDRRDKLQRAELCRGTVEFLAGSEFLLRPMQDPRFLFVVDVSYTAAVTGMVTIALNSVRTCLDALAQNPRNKIGIMTFDHQMQFYSLKSDKGEPSMMVIADVDEPFVPCPSDDMFVSASEGRDILDAVLDLIGTLYEQPAENKTNSVYCASGCAMAAASQALTGVGGKILLITANLCNAGVGKLASREDGSLYGTPKEHTLFQPQIEFYSDLAKQCAEEAITVDVFVCANSYVDIATIGSVPDTTGGQLYLYPGFNANKDAFALQRDVWRNVTRETGYDGVMVVRCTAGLRVVDYYGNFYRRQPGEMDLPSIDSDKSFAVRLEHEGALEDKSEASVQVALLYTSAFGERKIRVHNLSLAVTSAMANVFRFSDLDSIINLSLKQAVSQVKRGVPYADAQAALCLACVDCLYVYRKNCASASSAGQLILPEPLKLLPLSTLGLIKHPLLQPSISADHRAFLFSYIASMPAYVSVSFTCPRLYCLTDMPAGTCVMNEMGRVFLPPNLNLSKESMTDDGIYVLDNGQQIYMWIGEAMDDSLSFEMFGCSGPQPQSVYQIKNNGDETSLAGRSLTLVETLRSDKPMFKNLQTISRIGNARNMASLDHSAFLSHLIEDSSDTSGKRLKALAEVNRMSYIDFLCFIHKEIQKKFY